MSEKDHDKSIVVDFDGTLAEDHKFPDMGEPMPGAIKAMKKLKDAGFEIVVFTCRMNLTHGRREAELQRKAIEEWLERHEVPYDRIDDGKEGKPFALFYVDNKNLEYRGGNDWERLYLPHIGLEVKDVSFRFQNSSIGMEASICPLASDSDQEHPAP